MIMAGGNDGIEMVDVNCEHGSHSYKFAYFNKKGQKYKFNIQYSTSILAELCNVVCIFNVIHNR